jgi:hypothetical protein
MSRYIAKTTHLEIPKRSITWNGGSIFFPRRFQGRQVDFWLDICGSSTMTDSSVDLDTASSDINSQELMRL